MKKTLIILAIGCIILIGAPFIVSAQGECLIEVDCPTGQNCINLICVTPYGGNCTSNAQCASNWCDLYEGSCGCVTNAHCPSGQICDSAGWCVSGRAYGGFCSSNAQCTSGICITELGLCGCAQNSDCPDGGTCDAEHTCSGGTSGLLYGEDCTANSQCMSNICDPIDRFCLCTNSNQCPLGYPTCNTVSNVCESSGESGTGARFCHAVLSDGEVWMWYEYNSAADCTSGCPIDCSDWISDCESYCCLSTDRDGQDNACSGEGGPGGPGSGGSAIIPNPLKCEDVECIIKAIADMIAGLVTVIGTIMIIIGGIQYITSAGNEDRARRAKNTVLYAIIGIAIAVSVDFIIGFLREILGSGS